MSKLLLNPFSKKINKSDKDNLFPVVKWPVNAKKASAWPISEDVLRKPSPDLCLLVNIWKTELLSCSGIFFFNMYVFCGHVSNNVQNQIYPKSFNYLCGSGAWSASAAGGREWGWGSGTGARERVWLYTGVPVQLMTLSPISTVARWGAGCCPGNKETTWRLTTVCLLVPSKDNKRHWRYQPESLCSAKKPTVTRRVCYTGAQPDS